MLAKYIIVLVYWMYRGIIWPYYIRHKTDWLINKDYPILVPMGYSEFPKELFSPPKTLADQFYKNIIYWENIIKVDILQQWSSQKN